MTPYQASKLLFFMWGENMGFIYKITNDVNGKVYIGKTLNTVESRWKEHCHDKDRRNMENRPLYRAMNKYGLEHFSIETIEECYENLEEREIYWIKYYNSYVGWPDSNGYNATFGGDGKPYVNYDEIIQWAKNGKTQIEIAEIVGCCVDTVVKALTQAHIQMPEYKEHVSIAVYQKDREGNILAKYASISEAAKATCIDPTHIGQCCAGKRKTSGGYYWEYVNPEDALQRKIKGSQSKITASREELKYLVRNFPMEIIGKKYGCSTATVCRRLKQLNLPSTKTKINSYSDSDWAAL